MLITGNYVTTNANDKKELLPNIDQVNEEVFTPAEVLSDSGYYSEQSDQEYNLKRMFSQCARHHYARRSQKCVNRLPGELYAHSTTTIFRKIGDFSLGICRATQNNSTTQEIFQNHCDYSDLRSTDS